MAVQGWVMRFFLKGLSVNFIIRFTMNMDQEADYFPSILTFFINIKSSGPNPYGRVCG